MRSVRTLVVDDSGFFRRRIAEALNEGSGVEVVGEAANGREAIAAVQRLQPDVVTMDIEMPVMDGISAVREIMRRCPTPVLMFSSLTHDGAKATLDALDAGAVDFLPKRLSDLSANAEQARQMLRERVRQVGRRGARRRAVSAPAAREAPRRAVAGAAASPPVAPRPPSKARLAPGRVKLVVIGTSTGGPLALQKVLTTLPTGFPLPLLLVQHMPATFTPAFAARLNDLCAIEVREAKEGDVLTPGLALLAPGGQQCGLQRLAGRTSVRLFPAEPGQFYKPSVDVAFSEAARHYRDKVLGVVLTGMGADGCQGARELKQSGSVIWSQDEASSVIYGMPAAVAKAGLSDGVYGLEAVGPALAELRA